jgi:hypothetical protein
MLEITCRNCGKIFQVRGRKSHRKNCSRECHAMTAIEKFLKVGWTVKPSGCWEWNGKGSAQGYGYVYHGNGKTLAHRVSWENTFGPVPDGLGVLHKCDNPPCVNPDHFFVGTNADNTRDRNNKGRANVPNGESHWKSILTEKIVCEIRAYPKRHPQYVRVLAEVYNVSISTIRLVLNRKIWRHVS